MNRQKKAKEVLDKLRNHYPKVECALKHVDAFQLLIATVLSAQCTDVRVNMVTPILFGKYPTAKDLAAADIEDVKEIIHSTGFYNNKSKNIIGAAKMIMEDFDGKVPNNMEDLVKLSGVARKTANVVLGVWYKTPEGIAVDTHVRRLANLLKLTTSRDPVHIENDLLKVFPKEESGYIGLALIQYGRDFCTAKNHDESKCFLGGHSKTK